MKAFFLLLVVCLSGSCAQTTFHYVDRDSSGKISRADESKKDIGLVYYQPVPHLLVQRPLNKDGATTAKIVYLPDTANPMAMRFRGGFGSASMNVTMSNGMISSFNQTADAKIPELLASLTAPVTGLATAEATRATAGLTAAQEDELRQSIRAAASVSGVMDNSAFADPESYTSDSRCDPGSSTWLSPPPSTNSDVLSEDIEVIVAAANTFACQSEKLEDAGLNSEATEPLQAASELLYVVSSAYENDETRYWVQRILGKNPVATPLRVAVKPFEKIDYGESEQLSQIEDKLKLVSKRIVTVANKYDPPKATKPKEPFELYRIDSNGANTTLTRVYKQN